MSQLSKQPNKKQWLLVIEFAAVGFATWFNPEAGFLLFLLKLCFQILKTLQKNDKLSDRKCQPGNRPKPPSPNDQP
jgi:hypothetical protein